MLWHVLLDMDMYFCG